MVNLSCCNKSGVQAIFYYSKESLILTSKILSWSEDLTTFWISKRSTFPWALQLRSLTLFEKN